MGEQLAVTLTVGQLDELIERAAARAVHKAVTAQEPEVMSLQQAAAFLQRHPKVVARMIRTEGLPAHYISEREPRFRRSELLDWLARLPSKPTETE